MPVTEDPLASEPPASRPVARSLGERLRQAREAKGMTLADISAKTRVPQRQLAALEADAHEAMPGVIFAIGFAKSFAREVGLDPDEISAQFKAETTRASFAPTTGTAFEALEPEKLPSRGLAWAGAAAAALLIGGLIWYYNAKDAAPDAEVAAVETPAPDGIADNAAPADVPPAPTTTQAAATPAAPPAPGALPAPNIPVGGTAVTLSARQDVWIQISDRATGSKVMSRVLRQGETYSVPEGGDYTLWTGRAGALDVRVGGRPVPPLGGEVETIRDVSLLPGSLLGRVAASAPIPSIRPAAGGPGASN